MKIAKVERKIEYFPIIGGEIKATNDGQGIVEGYLNYIGNIDFGDDRTMPGAFKKTLDDSYARKSAQGLDFLWPYLFNHDYSQLPPGGIFDADVKLVKGVPKGLYTKTRFNLDMQMGRELYSSFKMGTMKKQSMGYKAIQVEYVKDEATGRTIRNLLEVAVMEGSAVVFPMNDLAQVDTVKRRYFFMDGLGTKTVCGDTSLPIGPRDESWDASKARSQYQAWGTDSDGKPIASKYKQVHLQVDGDAGLLGSYKYPFCYISNGSPVICVGGVKAAAGALSGARNASPGGDGAGMRAKVATMYGKINKKYPDDTPLVPPWKGNVMDIWSKDYAESYQDATQQDWITDLWNLWYPLRNEIIQAFVTGDTPAEDVDAALEQFNAAVRAYVQQGITLNMTECLEPSDDSVPGMPGMMMSAADNPETKDAKLLSAASHAKLTKSVDSAMMHMREMKTELARQRANALQGYQVYGEDDPVPEQKQEEGDKQPQSTPAEDIHSVLHDLTLLLSADNANRGL